MVMCLGWPLVIKSPRTDINTRCKVDRWTGKWDYLDVWILQRLFLFLEQVKSWKLKISGIFHRNTSETPPN